MLRSFLVQDKFVSNKQIDPIGPEMPKFAISKRNVYSEQTKKLLVGYIEEYGYSEVKKQAGVPHDTLKTIKKTYSLSLN